VNPSYIGFVLDKLNNTFIPHLLSHIHKSFKPPIPPSFAHRWLSPPVALWSGRGDAPDVVDHPDRRNREGEPSVKRIDSLPFAGDRRRRGRFAHLRPPLPPSTTSSPPG
jgi:hypothetical protein